MAGYAEMSRRHRIAVIPGDGIGQETAAAGVRVLEHVGANWGFELELEWFPWGCDHLARTGAMMDADGIERLRAFDAILLGAVGDPSVPDDVSLWGLLIPIRQAFRQYVNLRPIRLFEGVEGPLRDRGPGDVDLLVVRENNEGEYSDIGGRTYPGLPEEVALQVASFSRHGTERVMRFALELARRRGKGLASATKSNGIRHAMPFWDETLRELSGDYPDVELSEYHVDAIAAMLVRDPTRFDVIVASNLFGDIISDLAAAVAGSLGLAPSANLNPEREHPSMFEPVHGSAPDIAGRGIANPIGQIWSVAMMLDHLGETDGATALVGAVERTLRDPATHTPDLGGTARTAAVTDAVIGLLDGG
jgi:tartrate dehydrogenase/decarboxylase/D-malate dehydrogenase